MDVERVGGDGGPVQVALVAADAVAMALSVSADTVYALIRTGELRSVLVKRRRVLPRDAIQQLLADRVKRTLGWGSCAGGCLILVACCLA